MSTSPIWDVYADELLPMTCGHPMWYPEGVEGEGIPDRGDVGYISKGRFRRLFNVCHPTPAQLKKLKSGISIDPLKYDERLDDIRRDALQNKVFSKRSLKERDIKGGGGADGSAAGVPVSGQIELHCSTTTERGAFLLLGDSATIETVESNTVFPTYMMKHHREWLREAEALGLNIKNLDIILLQGAVKTTNWMVAAFQNVQRGQEVDVSGSFANVGQLSFHWSGTTTSTSGIEHRAGPRPPLSRTPSPDPSFESRASPAPMPQPVGTDHPLHLTPSHGSSESTRNTQYDQCIFLPRYKMRRRLPFLPRKIDASAGPHRLPGTDRDDDMAPAIAVTEDDAAGGDDQVPGPRNDPVDAILEYILANSDADAAIACDGDVRSLFVDSPHTVSDNLRQWLGENRPKIQVEGDFAMLSMKEAVIRERKATIARLMRQVLNDNMAADNMTFHPIPAAIAGLGAEGSGPSGSGAGQPGHGGGGGGGGHQGAPPRRSYEVKDLLGEGLCLLGKDAASSTTDETFDWPHLMLSEEEMEGGAISTISIAPDGEHVATGSDDTIVRVWNVKTGQLVQKWQRHEDVVWAVAFSPTGTEVASGSADTNIYLWDPRWAPDTGIPARLAGHTADVWTLSYSPDGKKLASGSVDNTIRVWDPAARQLLRTLTGHTTQIMHLAWTADSERLVACAEARGIVWNASTGDQVAVIQGHAGAIWSMAVSHNGDRVITGSEDHSARIWDTRTGQELVVLHEHTGPIWSVAWSPDDEEVVTGAYDSMVVTNNSWTGEHAQTFSERPAIVDSVAYSSNTKHIASGSADGTVKLWNRGDGSMIAEWRGHTDKCKSVAFVNGNKDLLTSSDDGSLRVWSVQDILRLV